MATTNEEDDGIDSGLKLWSRYQLNSLSVLMQLVLQHHHFISFGSPIHTHCLCMQNSIEFLSLSLPPKPFYCVQLFFTTHTQKKRAHRIEETLHFLSCIKFNPQTVRTCKRLIVHCSTQTLKEHMQALRSSSFYFSITH